MANRTTLKAQFSAGQSVVESDFTTLIDSLAHLTDDVASGALASGSDITALNASIASLQALANTTKDELDNYVGEHPTLAEVQAADSSLSNSINSSIQTLAILSDSQHRELESSLGTLLSNFTNLSYDLNEKWSIADQAISAVPSTYATIADLNTREANLEILANSKADSSHTHSEYATKSSIADFITASDIPVYAPASHQHTASDISGLGSLFISQVEAQALIDASKVEFDFETALYDNFYDKEEVDQKFIVARWRTDQVSLFSESIVSIAQPFVDLARQKLEVSISQVRTSLFADKTSILGELSQTRAEIEVSINNTNSTVELNRLYSQLKRVSIQGGINEVKASIGALNSNLKLSISTTRTDALAAVSSLRADAGADDATTLSSANTYTDTKISGLLNGAGDAYNTLKELQEHITSNDSSAAQALTTQVGLLQGQITANDGDLSGVVVSLGNIHGLIDTVELRATTLESQDVTFQNNLDAFQATYDTLIASNNAMTTAYNDLLSRVTTLENTAYAQAGYVFP